MIDVAIEFCKNSGVLRINLVTANGKAANFYEKKGGFIYNNIFSYSMTPNCELKVYKMTKYLGDKIINNVTIVGGTHGNELTGVVLVKQIQNKQDNYFQRSNFNITGIIGNQNAVDANVRFLDEDLNRQFLLNDNVNNVNNDNNEIKISKYLNNLLGPKLSINTGFNIYTKSDFIIDLHSTNANTGIVAMISGENDCFANRIAYYLIQKHSELKITFTKGSKNESWSVDSITPSGIAFEVGSVHHGTLCKFYLEKTRILIQDTLDYIEKHNHTLINLNRDYIINKESKNIVSNINIPSIFPKIEGYIFVGKILYPLLLENQYIIHPSFVGKDWIPLIFNETKIFISVNSESNEIIFSKDMLDESLKLPDDIILYPLFINEASYQINNIAFSLYKKIEKVIY